MLLFDETVAAINAIDTDKEILHNACKRVLGLSVKRPGFSAEQNLMSTLSKLCDQQPTETVILALVALLAFTLASNVKEGREHKILDEVQEVIRLHYRESLMVLKLMAASDSANP